jgi:integrase
LRHTFASWLALAGVDIYRIKTLMRHKTIDMTMRYAHLLPDATRQAVYNLTPPKPSQARPL